MAQHEKKEKDSDALTLADHIRLAAKESGLSVYALAKMVEVSQPNLNRFLTGEQDNIRLDIAEKLFRALGLVVTIRNPKSWPKKPAR